MAEAHERLHSRIERVATCAEVAFEGHEDDLFVADKVVRQFRVRFRGLVVRFTGEDNDLPAITLENELIVGPFPSRVYLFERLSDAVRTAEPHVNVDRHSAIVLVG